MDFANISDYKRNLQIHHYISTFGGAAREIFHFEHCKYLEIRHKSELDMGFMII